jgi:hypothetical protein
MKIYLTIIAFVFTYTQVTSANPATFDEKVQEIENINHMIDQLFAGDANKTLGTYLGGKEFASIHPTEFALKLGLQIEDLKLEASAVSVGLKIDLGRHFLTDQEYDQLISSLNAAMNRLVNLIVYKSISNSDRIKKVVVRAANSWFEGRGQSKGADCSNLL